MHRSFRDEPVCCCALLAAAAGVRPLDVRAEEAGKADVKDDFLKLCDLACKELNSEARQQPKPVPFCVDSYAVRALAVASDMTGKDQYIDTCRQWSDRMVDFQDKMIPKGIYYMTTTASRREGRRVGTWPMGQHRHGVLATAVRCKDQAKKDRYMKSVEVFAEMVIDNYVGEAGGITDGYWDKYGGEWWCSTGLFGSLAFLLYAETGKERYWKRSWCR